MEFSLIDTHLHLWDPSRFSYSWLSGFPAIGGRAWVREYGAAAAGLGVIGAVYVDADVDERDLAEETKRIFALAEDPAQLIAGAVPGAKLEKARWQDHLEPFWGHRKLKGVRRVLHTQPDELSTGAQFVANVRSLARENLSFDLCVLARQLPVALELVRKCPEVSFILDHCGIPNLKARDLDPWRDDLRRLAREPNVACKISGLPAYADPAGWSADDLRPVVGHVLECFGWDRVMWGGDWPVCTLACSLRRWVDAARSLVAEAEPDQQRRLFSQNARRIYRLDPPE